MGDYKTNIEIYFTGSFVSGFGVLSDFAFLDFSKKDKTYRIWIDTDWELKDFQVRGNLNQEQNELLMLNELNNQMVKSFKIDSENNIRIIFSDAEVILNGTPKDENVMEPWRIYQTAPEKNLILIHSV